MRVAAKITYKGGDGILIGIEKRAPKEALTKADVVSLAILKRKGKRVVQSDVSYFTPDEAMVIAIGLLKAVDDVMGPSFLEFRKRKDAR